MARVEHAIWRDIEFTNLSRMAQWIYLTRRGLGQGRTVTLEMVTSWARGVEVEEARAAINELHGTKYGHVLARTSRRLSIPKRIRQEVYAADGWKCVVCGTKDNLEIDHIIPLSRGGTDVRSNLQTMCAHHNRKKGARIG